MTSPMYTNRVDATGPDLFTVETGPDDSTTVRALSASGEQLWTEAAPGPPVMGDSFGGLVAALPDSTEDSRGLARFAGPASAPPWHYESPGYVVGPAQAPDGAIYAVEWLPGIDSGGAFIWDKFAIALDGTTGRVTARRQPYLV